MNRRDIGPMRRVGLYLLFVAGILSTLATGGGGGTTQAPPEPPPSELTWNEGNWDEVNWQ